MMYHFFYCKENGEIRSNGNYVEVKEFEDQLKSLNDNGYTSLTMK